MVGAGSLHSPVMTEGITKQADSTDHLSMIDTIEPRKFSPSVLTSAETTMSEQGETAQNVFSCQE